jgi:hypothetical protein
MTLPDNFNNKLEKNGTPGRYRIVTIWQLPGSKQVKVVLRAKKKSLHLND